MSSATAMNRHAWLSTDGDLTGRRHDPDAVPVGMRGNVVEPTAENCRVDVDLVGPDAEFEPHYHAHDQLAWMAGGGVDLRVGGTQWPRLRRDHFAWIPAGHLHEMRFAEPGELISLYADVRLRPPGAQWDRPHVLGADPLAGSLLWHLHETSCGRERRALVLALLQDLLGSAAVHHHAIAMPRDPRARTVAEALLADPTESRELGEWARDLGVSERTLARGFEAIGVGFRRWRVHARMHAAAGLLERGDPVAEVAEAVGYASTSAFVAAFRGHAGRTPGTYAREYAAR